MDGFQYLSLLLAALPSDPLACCRGLARFLHPSCAYDPAMHGSWLSLIAMILLVGAALLAATVWFMALILLKPPRMTDGKAAWVLKRLSPGDLGLHFEEVSFSIRDEQSGGAMQIAAWWIRQPLAHGPQAHGRCVLMLHGYGDAKVGAIAWAPTFHDLGCNLLVIDLRAHGESGGHYSTAGYFERHDVAQVIEQMRAQRPRETQQVVLFGLSLGGAVAAAVAADRSDLSGIILECPFPDYQVAATAHAKLIGAPGKMILRWAYALAQRISRADFTAVRTVDTLRRATCPLMIVQSEADLMLNAADRDAIEAAARSRPTGAGPLMIWRVDNAPHLAAIFQNPTDYRQRIGAFLEQAWRWKLIQL